MTSNRVQCSGEERPSEAALEHPRTPDELEPQEKRQRTENPTSQLPRNVGTAQDTQLPKWLSDVEWTKTLFNNVAGINAATLTVKEFCSLALSVKQNPLVTELLRDKLTTISCGLGLEALSVNDEGVGKGKQKSQLLREVFARLAGDETRDSPSILPVGMTADRWESAVSIVYHHNHYCCYGMGFGTLPEGDFAKLGRPLLHTLTVEAALPLIGALWLAPMLGFGGESCEDFDAVHAAYNKLLKKHPGLERVLDPAFVMVDGGAVAPNMDLCPVGPATDANGLPTVNLVAAPALVGDMARCWRVANLTEARTVIATLRQQDANFKMLGLSCTAGNFATNL